MKHVAINPLGDLLFYGAIEDCVLPLLFGGFGNVAEINFAIEPGSESSKLRLLSVSQEREIFEVEFIVVISGILVFVSSNSLSKQSCPQKATFFILHTASTWALIIASDFELF